MPCPSCSTKARISLSKFPATTCRMSSITWQHEPCHLLLTHTGRSSQSLRHSSACTLLRVLKHQQAAVAWSSCTLNPRLRCRSLQASFMTVRNQDKNELFAQFGEVPLREPDLEHNLIQRCDAFRLRRVRPPNHCPWAAEMSGTRGHTPHARDVVQGPRVQRWQPQLGQRNMAGHPQSRAPTG